MINQLLLILSLITIYEFIKFIKFKNEIYLNLNIYKKLIKIFFLKKISDTRKEKLIFIYSKKLFVVSIKILFVIVVILLFVLSFNFISNTFLNLVFSIYGFFEILFVFVIYHKLRS